MSIINLNLSAEQRKRTLFAGQSKRSLETVTRLGGAEDEEGAEDEGIGTTGTTGTTGIIGIIGTVRIGTIGTIGRIDTIGIIGLIDTIGIIGLIWS